MRVARFAVGLMVALGLVLAANKGGAMWAELSDQELIESSEIIATGTLIGTTRVTIPPKGVDLILGVLRIETVLKGDAGRKVALIVLPAPTPGFITTDLMTYKTGQSGLWFLEPRARAEQGLYHANHPQRFLPFGTAADDIEKFKKLLGR